MRHLYALINILNTCIQMMPSLTCNDNKNTHSVVGMWKTGTALCSENITYSH